MVRAQLSEDTEDQVIDEIARRFQARHVQHLWFLPEDSRPADLAQRLEAHGRRRQWEGVGMAMDLAAIAEPFPPPPG